MSQPILNPAITEYLLELHTLQSRSPFFKHMEDMATKESFPIVGPLVGRLLSLLAQTIGAKRIFEFGSGFGYSALWFAQGLHPEGNILCVDGDQKNAERAQSFFRDMKETRIDFYVGRAQDIFATT